MSDTQSTISYDDFKKLDMRVGKICSVEILEGSDKLLICQIDFGEFEEIAGVQEGEVARDETNEKTGKESSTQKPKLRQIVSGIREFFPEYKELEGKMALYVVNLEPREIRGVMSHGMLMAVDGVDGKPVFLTPEQKVLPGSRVR